MRLPIALIDIAVFVPSLVTADDLLDEAKAIQKIELLGGNVTGDEALPEHRVVGIDFQRNDRISDGYLRLVKHHILQGC